MSDPYVHPSIIDPTLGADPESTEQTFTLADGSQIVGRPVLSREEFHRVRAREGQGPPPPEIIEAVRQFHIAQREDLLRRVAAIEALLGFVDVADGLAVRVARLESFCGVKA